MRNFILAGILAAVAIPAMPAIAQNGPDPQYQNRRDDDRRDERRDDRRDDRGRPDDRRGGPGDRGRGPSGPQSDFRRYDYNRPDPRYGNYQADRYYRQGNYGNRRLGNNDRIYRGRDNRYYCRRDDGTTGLIIGGLGGGVLGNIIAPGGSKTLGTILGGGAGALLGRSVDRNNVTCR